MGAGEKINMVTSSKNVGNEQRFWRKGETHFMHNEWRIWMSCIISKEENTAMAKYSKKTVENGRGGFYMNRWTDLWTLEITQAGLLQSQKTTRVGRMWWRVRILILWRNFFPAISTKELPRLVWSQCLTRQRFFVFPPLKTSQTGSIQVSCLHQVWVLVDWRGDPVLLGFVFFIQSPRQVGESLLLKAENTKGGGYCRLWRDARPASEQTEEAIKGLQGTTKENWDSVVCQKVSRVSTRWTRNRPANLNTGALNLATDFLLSFVDESTVQTAAKYTGKFCFP